MNPTVSIIMATYNRSKYILESIESIINQTYTDWECIIVDDGSTDDTGEVLAPILKKDARFKYFKRTSNYQKGLPGCRNFGLDLVKGNYIIFFDDDDIAHPQNLELCLFEFSKNDISFCRYIRDVFTGNFVYDFDYSKEYTSFFIDNRDIDKILKNELQFNSCAVMWKKECFKGDKFTETLMYAEEWELYSRIISSGIVGISIEKCLFYGRKHPNSNTGEYHRNNPVRKASYADAIELVVMNLKNKNLLSTALLHYFIHLSLNFKEYNLFDRIVISSGFSLLSKWRWTFFFHILPLRLFFYGIKKEFLLTKKVVQHTVLLSI